MTHNGPFLSNTTIKEYNKNKIIESGSRSITDFILKNKKNILFNCHGHTHLGKRFDKIENILILNPGSVKVTKSY